MGWIDTELALTALAAMLSPTTLMFSVLALVLVTVRGGRVSGSTSAPWAQHCAVGIVAAFVIGDVASSSSPNTPKTWVAIVDVVAAGVLLVLVVTQARRPANPERIAE